MGNNDTIDDSNKLWINQGRQCVWINVACTDGSVTELDVAGSDVLSHLGTIATEIGLLKNLSAIDMSSNNLYGRIPTELGEWESLTYIGMDHNLLTGTIPSEKGKLPNLKWLGL